MQLRDSRLLLVILGIANSKQVTNRPQGQAQDVYRRATSTEGLLSIRKYWDSHCSTFSKLPAIALVAPSSCPKGLAPSLFVELLGRLTDLQPWQIWDLWSTLDVHRCGLVGCAEFTLLVVLACAGVAEQPLLAVHAFASSICRTFTGPHVGGNAHEGLRQCCQLMGLPVSTLYATLQQLRLLEHTCSHRSSYCSYCSSSSRRRNEAPGHCAAAPSCSKLGNKGGSLSSSKGLQRVGVLRPPAGSSPPQTTAAATGLLGCACSRSDAGCSASTAQQWACGAAAHRQHCADSKTQPTGLTAAQRTTTEAVVAEVVLYQVAKEHQLRLQGLSRCSSPTDDAECTPCRMC